MAKKEIKKNQLGFSLIETLVAVSIFSVVIFLLSGTFKSVVDGQRNAIGAQNTQESMAYAFEIMGKEIRNAKLLDVDCLNNFGISRTYKVFNKTTLLGNDILYFQNKNDLCVQYLLENDNGINRLKIIRDDPDEVGVEFVGYITPDEIRVSNLNFSIIDNLFTGLKIIQPKVTIKMEAEMAGGSAIQKQKMTIQTTVSSRNYDEF